MHYSLRPRCAAHRLAKATILIGDPILGAKKPEVNPVVHPEVLETQAVDAFEATNRGHFDFQA